VVVVLVVVVLVVVLIQDFLPRPAGPRIALWRVPGWLRSKPALQP
jgi:hypothetical protein